MCSLVHPNTPLNNSQGISYKVYCEYISIPYILGVYVRSTNAAFPVSVIAKHLSIHKE